MSIRELGTISTNELYQLLGMKEAELFSARLRMEEFERRESDRLFTSMLDAPAETTVGTFVEAGGVE